MMRTSYQDRMLSALATAVAIALFGYMLFVGLTVDPRARSERLTMLLNLRAPPPPPPPRPRIERQRSPRAAARPSPRNLRNKAAEIVTLPPLVPPVLPPPVIAAAKAGTGMAPSAGASDRAGPGTGAGGAGNGSGGGGEGDGDGDDTPPRLIRGRLKFSDLPAALRDATAGGTVGVRYEVGADGRASGCVAATSSGDPALDQATCRLIEQRFRFAPSRDPDGAPVPSTIEENHSWMVDRGSDTPPHP